MKRFTIHARSVATVAGMFAVLLMPVVAAAQDVPSYAHPVVVSTDETIHGRITSVNGAFNITVDDDRGFLDSVELHSGTIINPTGLSLSPGMSVTIAGYNAGDTFNANQIDTPYSYSGPLPTPVYYGAGYWCPGYGYGYGPSFSLAIVFGGGYRFEHRSFYGRPWDGRRYFGDYVGHRDGGRDPGGERRGFAGEHRSFAGTGDVRTETGGHVPTAFAGRSFAGESRANPRAGSRTEVNRANGENRAAVTGGGIYHELHRAPAPGGFSRAGAQPGVTMPGAATVTRGEPGRVGGGEMSRGGGGGGMSRGGGGAMSHGGGGGGASHAGGGGGMSHGGGAGHGGGGIRR